VCVHRLTYLVVVGEVGNDHQFLLDLAAGFGRSETGNRSLHSAPSEGQTLQDTTSYLESLLRLVFLEGNVWASVINQTKVRQKREIVVGRGHTSKCGKYILVLKNVPLADSFTLCTILCSKLGNAALNKRRKIFLTIALRTDCMTSSATRNPRIHRVIVAFARIEVYCAFTCRRYRHPCPLEILQQTS
jgi:hypothetical protein